MPRMPTSIGQAACETATSLAVELGWVLCRGALWSGDQCTWLGAEQSEESTPGNRVSAVVSGDLYGGTAGIALYLAQLFSVARESALRRTCYGALLYAMSNAN